MGCRPKLFVFIRFEGGVFYPLATSLCHQDIHTMHHALIHSVQALDEGVVESVSRCCTPATSFSVRSSGLSTPDNPSCA